MNRSPGRLLLTLEAAEDSLALIDVATRLAAVLERELVGLLVPDPGLEAAAALPFTRLQPLRGPGPALFDRPDMERALRAFKGLVERRLAAACAGCSIRWSLTVAGGQAAVPPPSGDDLLVLGPRTPPGGFASPPACPIVVVRPGGGSVVLVHSGGDGLVDVAQRTARCERRSLVVILLETRSAGEAGRPDGDQGDLVHVRAADPVALAAALRRYAPAILFLDTRLPSRELAVILAALRSTPELAADHAGVTG